VSDRPERKRRKVSYAGADDTVDDDKPYTNDDRLAIATRDANRFPVFKAKHKDTAFKQRFSIPLVNKDVGGYDAGRPSPLLGMRKGKVFQVKPLHDPSGEFAIVLYDPTIDDKPSSSEDSADSEKTLVEPEKVKLDVPLVHKSLADILGIKKTVEERPKVPVVIDPRLAKVLRPHQVEGVKVRFWSMKDETDCVVHVSRHHRDDRPQSSRLHHGRRDGTRQNGKPPSHEIGANVSAPMHRLDVDSPEAGPERRQVDHPEVRRRLPVESCAQLGQRAWFVFYL
jgi:hypothetical protein